MRRTEPIGPTLPSWTWQRGQRFAVRVHVGDRGCRSQHSGRPVGS